MNLQAPLAFPVWLAPGFDRCEPVFDQQARYARAFAEIVCHQRESGATRVGCDAQVVDATRMRRNRGGMCVAEALGTAYIAACLHVVANCPRDLGFEGSREVRAWQWFSLRSRGQAQQRHTRFALEGPVCRKPLLGQLIFVTERQEQRYAPFLSC